MISSLYAGVTGAGGVDQLTVDVDAATGEVTDSREGVLRANSVSSTNGPFTVATTQAGSVYLLTDPVQHNLTCQDYSSGQTYTSTTDTWGSGAPTHKVTGCADAMFAAQTETKMLSA